MPTAAHAPLPCLPHPHATRAAQVLLLTHGGAPPPDTPAGQPMAWEMFYQQRGQQAQNMLRQVAGDQR